MQFYTKRILSLIGLVLLSQACLKPRKISETKSEPVSRVQETVPATADMYAEHVRTTAFRTAEEERQSFILPPGFEVTLFASEPDITKPINMAFDEKGRLWVSQSSEYPVEAGPGGGNDRITILEDTDGDGRADKIQDFAKGLNIPIGIMPVKGGAIGYSIPNVYRFTDADGDGQAEKREVMLGPFGHKDTHGMINNLIRGFDGWMHASHGYANTSVVSGTDKDSVRMFSGNTFRFKPDGSRVEKTTDGRINPFGSAFDEMGYHYSADCHTLPIYQLIWGGDYTQWGKREISMGFAPTMMDYGLNSTALAGLVYYTDNQFPAEYQNSFYSGDVVTCRISRNVMSFKGATPQATRKEDFLVSKDPWFRPVDIKIGPDGAMYIADFYNRIIGHYEVPINHPGRDRISGRIWKITYTGKPQRKPIDWSKASQRQLLDGLNHEVLGIRMTATDELVARFGVKAVPALKKVVAKPKTNYRQLIQGLWALYQLNALPEEALRAAIDHADVRVKVHAFKIMANGSSLSGSRRTLALQGLTHADPHVQRAAAEVLGRHQHQQHIGPLLALVAKVPDYDTHLRYTVLLAIKNHLQQESILQQAVTEKWNEKDSAVLALILADVNSARAGTFLLSYLKAYPQSAAQTQTYTQAIARTIPESQLNQVVAFARKEAGSNAHQQYQLAKAVQQGLEQRGALPGSTTLNWFEELAANFLEDLSAGNTAEEKARQQYAAEVAGRYKVVTLEPKLKQLLARCHADENVRAAAAAALIGIAAEKNAALVAQILQNGDERLAMRQKAAQALSQSEKAAVRQLLGQGLRNAPFELQETIGSLLVNNAEGKTQLLRLIRQGYAPARLLKARAVEERLLTKISAAQRQEFEALSATITPISEERQKLIEARLATFNPSGKTVAMGNALFIKNCSMCHQINKKGGLIGPQLDGIGNWGRTALTTKILDPNRNISENFRQYNITLKNGETVTGLYRREEGQSLVLANPAGKEFSVAKEDIQEKVASKYTLMPDHFSTTISKDDFDALMVFLLNTR